jgi:hypothetical protein
MPKPILSGRWSVPKGKDGHFLFRDIAGERFGRLIAIRATEERRSGHIAWLCRCDCGRSGLFSGKKLRTGHTKSCGCWKVDQTRKRATTHGATAGRTETREYRTWKSMLARCLQPNREDFKYYGGRGITVCERWLVFENFLADMGSKPSGLTIERIDNDAGYFPGNCKWATRFEQMANTRKPKRRR